MLAPEQPEPAPPYIPPELRGYIARFCDRRALARLCSVCRLWASEAEPVLYDSVHLFLGRGNSKAILEFIDGLVRSARRASFIHRLLVEHSGHDDDLTPEVLSALEHAVAALPGLVDLRLRGNNFAFLVKMLTVVVSPQRRFRLHTLYLSQRPVIETPNFFKDVLYAHASSLRVLGIKAEDPRYLWSAAKAHWQHPEDDSMSLDLTQALHTDCARFAFVRRPRRLALFVHEASAPKIAAVAHSLAVDPCDNFAGRAVETLQMEWVCGSGSERAELSRAFSMHFPLTHKVELLIHGDMDSAGVDVAALVEAVAPFAAVQVLDIMEYYRRPSQDHNAVSPLIRKGIMDKLVAVGCLRLREVRFPDGSSTRAIEPDGA